MRNLKLVIKTIIMASMILFISACGGDRIYIDPPPLPATELIIELLPDNSATITKTDYLQYDMDFYWDDGLIITNNDVTVVAYRLVQYAPAIILHYGIIEHNMTTAAMGIQLEPGKYEFVTWVGTIPENVYPNVDLQPRRPHPSLVVETPEGVRYAKDQVEFSFSKETEDSERHRVFREHNLFIVGVRSDIDSPEIRYWARIYDGRCPFDVADALNQEEAVLEASPRYV